MGRGEGRYGLFGGRGVDNVACGHVGFDVVVCVRGEVRERGSGIMKVGARAMLPKLPGEGKGKLGAKRGRAGKGGEGGGIYRTARGDFISLPSEHKACRRGPTSKRCVRTQGTAACTRMRKRQRKRHRYWRHARMANHAP